MTNEADAAKKQKAKNAAAVLLDSRLRAVWNWLGKCDNTGAPGDVEAVHQLRVSARRAAVALEVFQKLADKTEAAELKETLRQIRKAADSARDLDVLKEHCADGLKLISKSKKSSLTGAQSRKMIARLEVMRIEAQKPLLDLQQNLEEFGFGKRIADFILSIENSEEKHANKSFERWARKGVRRSAKKFLEAATENFDDDLAVHQMRIKAKKLRYTFELAGEALDWSENHRERLEIFQDAAGEMRDCTLASEMFLHWQVSADAAERAFLEGLFQGVVRAEGGLRTVSKQLWSAEDSARLARELGL